MASEVYQLVEKELDFLGDILCAGIIKKGLSKVPASPDDACVDDMMMALDLHIKTALVTFVGVDEANLKILNLKKKLAGLNGGGVSNGS